MENYREANNHLYGKPGVACCRGTKRAEKLLSEKIGRREFLKRSFGGVLKGCTVYAVFGFLWRAKIKKLFAEENSKKYIGTVKYRRLGKTNLMVSEVGVGGHEYNEAGWQIRQPLEERIKIIGKALDLGVNYFDTTSDGESRSLGKVLKALKARDKCYIAHGDCAQEFCIRNADEKFIREAVERQLEALQTDRIDVFRVLAGRVARYVKDYVLIRKEDHDLSIKQEIRKIAEILEKLKKEGKIRFSCYGIGAHSKIEPYEAEVGNLFDCMQIRYNFLENEPEEEVIPYTKGHDMGIIIVKPFRRGTLLNKFVGGKERDPQDLDLRKLSDPLFATLKYKEKGLAYALLKYVLSNKDISVVISGVGSVEQIVGNAGVSIFG